MVLATGTGKMLLGRELVYKGEHIPGAGIFDYSASETGEVFVSDCVVRPEAFAGEEMYGFLNQTLRVSYHTPPNLFRIVYGKGDTGQQQEKEGMMVKNCFATALLGPVLAKNPQFAREVIGRIPGVENTDYDDRLAQQALRLTLDEFSPEEHKG